MLSTAESRVCSQTKIYCICNGQSDTAKEFFPSSFVLHFQYPYLFIQAIYNVGGWTKGPLEDTETKSTHGNNNNICLSDCGLIPIRGLDLSLPRPPSTHAPTHARARAHTHTHVLCDERSKTYNQVLIHSNKDMHGIQ
jgi:hypothetical protein